MENTMPARSKKKTGKQSESTDAGPLGWAPPDLRGKVAVVAGASRGAGRGIALALGETGATVYVTGRTVRGGPKPPDGAPGTVEETAEAVTARGGRGIPVAVDFTLEQQVAALFKRVEREQGRLDIFANAVFSWSPDFFEAFLFPGRSKPRPFWERKSTGWDESMMNGAYAHLLGAIHAARTMARRRSGLIVSITEPLIGDTGGPLYWMFTAMGHQGINQIMKSISKDLVNHDIASIALCPGFMRTERVKMNMDLLPEKRKRSFRYDLSETPEYTGRAIASMAVDKNILKKSGQLLYTADLAKKYKFKDADGKFVDNFYRLVRMI
jgi:NAD(P)-dependent dehydrogenase (short-subunit alcohol dehydrogenase family)